MQLILFDDHTWDNLLPLTFTRPVSCLRVGILTVAEKWERMLGSPPSWKTRGYLSGKYRTVTGEDNLMINGALLPDPGIVRAIGSLKAGEALKKEHNLLAARTGPEEAAAFEPERWLLAAASYGDPVSLLDYPWKVYELNGQEIESDFDLLSSGRASAPLSETVQVVEGERIFVEEGFRGEHFTLNASSGPIYLGEGSEIMEGSMIRGPFALCRGSVVKMAAKIYGPTTIGPGSKVGGEINNSVIQGYTNKAHDGFLGNSVIGEWCNLGADTNNSNLKNNYSEVKIWNYPKKNFISTCRQFCGMFMGDHSKCGINTMFNTGTVVGVSANLFGPGFPRQFIPSFSWGGTSGLTTYQLEKALETASLVMERRGESLSGDDRAILEYIFHYSEPYRKKPSIWPTE